jgi:hypothetical protein
MVRIHLPPADSPGLVGTLAVAGRDRAFPAGLRRRVGGAVGRDAGDLAGIARKRRDISLGPYSSTAAPLLSPEVIAAPVAQPSYDRAQLLKEKPSRVRCCLRASGRRECASSLSGVSRMVIARRGSPA